MISFQLFPPLSIYFTTVKFTFVKQNIYISKERSSEFFCIISQLYYSLTLVITINLLQLNYKTYAFLIVHVYIETLL